MISNHILNDFCVSDLVCPFRPWRFRYDNIYIDIILDFILTRPFFLYSIPFFPPKRNTQSQSPDSSCAFRALN